MGTVRNRFATVETLSGKKRCFSRDVEGKDLECENPIVPRRRFNFEKCRKQEDCAESLSCLQELIGGDIPCEGGEDFRCYNEDIREFICSCRFPNCPDGEKCSLRDGEMVCVSIALNEPDITCYSFEPLPSQSSTCTKFTGESCKASLECTGERSCLGYTDEDFPERCEGKENCVCMPYEPEYETCSCKKSSCLPGDTCSFSYDDAVCISEPLDPHPIVCNASTMQPSDLDSNEIGKKSTFEICRTDDECADNRLCLTYELKKCTRSHMYTCQPRDERFRTCSCENQSCLSGDVCGFPEKKLSCQSTNVSSNPNNCLSGTEPSPAVTQPNAIITPDLPQDSPQLSPPPPQQLPSLSTNLCIDASALTHFHTHHLVFQHHPLSRVLCDQSGSCATPGHIIQYNGRPMMMKTYCEGVGCVEKVMEVNSPRYRRGVRVGSRTAGLEYTAFAARLETRGEEAFLPLFIYVGL